MSFSFATRTCTQTSTDANLTGISTAISAVIAVATSTAYSLGNIRLHPTAGLWLQCTTAGTSAASAPTYSTTIDVTTSDGTAVWTTRKAPVVVVTGTTGNIRTEYKLETFQINVTGTLTFDPDNEQLTFNEVPTSTAPVLVNGSGTFNMGVATTKGGITRYSSGVGIYNSKALGATNGFNGSYSDSGVVRVNSGTASFNWRGGVIISPTTPRIQDGNFLVEEGVLDCPYNSSSGIQPTFLINSGADTVSISNLTIKSNTAKNGVQINLEKAPNVFSNVVLYHGSGIGTFGSTIESPAGTSTPIELKDFGPKGDGLTGVAQPRVDYTFWRLNHLKAVNALDGVESPCYGMNITSNNANNRGLVNFWKEVGFQFNDAVTASAVQDVCIGFRDANDGLRPADYRGFSWSADRTYTWSSDVAGVAAAQQILIGCQVKSTNDDPFASVVKSRRTTANDSTNSNTFRAWSYGHNMGTITASMKGNGVLTSSALLVPDSNVTLSRTAAIAKLASSFTLDTGTNTLTVTANSSLDDMYDVIKAHKCQNNITNLEYPTVSTLAVSTSGSTILPKFNIVVNNGVTLSSGTKFNKIALDSDKTFTSNGTANINIDNGQFASWSTIPTANIISNSVQGVRITTGGTYDFSDWTFTGNTADVTVADSTGAVTIKTGGQTLVISQGTGNTVSIDNTVEYVLNFAILGGTLAMQNLGKFNAFQGVYVSHAVAQASLLTPAAADYYAVDSNSDNIREEHGYWNGSAWVVHASGIITEHEILATSNGGPGVGSAVTLNLLQGETWRIYADKIGYFPAGYPTAPIQITVPTGGGSKDIPLIENPTTIGIAGASYTTAQPLAAASTLLPADTNSIMTLKMPTLAGETTDVHFAFVELMRSSLENARGALAANSNKCVEVVDYIVRISDDTLRVYPLDSYPAGTKVMFEVPVVFDNYTIEFNPMNAIGNYVCVTDYPRQVVIGGTVLGTVAINTSDKEEIKKHVTAMAP